jgi:hypothetical protein
MTLSNEIEEALKKLTNLNAKMNDVLNSENNVNSSATMHTLQVRQVLNLNQNLILIY